MPLDALNDAKCRAAKPRERPYKLADGGGLHLWVSTTGARAWRLAYRVAGRAQTMSFGLYPEVGLAEARRRRDEARAQLRDGLDPMAPRRAKAGMTLREACQTYWDGRQDITDQYRTNALRAMEMHIWPWLGARPIAGVTRDDLMPVLLRMDAAGLADYVRKARMWLDQMWDWAVERGEAPGNPAGSIKAARAFTRQRTEHFAALEPAEVGELLKRMALERDLTSVLACRLLALTWVRTTELRLMRWDEVDGDTWRLPAGRMKRQRDHLVPLSRQAVAIVERMRERTRGGPYVFHGDRTTDKPMSENAVLYLLHRMGFKDRMTGHGWRSVASTWANEAGYPPDVIERQLAHAPADKVRAAYNRAEYIDQRRVMLQAWADWLDAQAG
jgi:integrase